MGIEHRATDSNFSNIVDSSVEHSECVMQKQSSVTERHEHQEQRNEPAVAQRPNKKVRVYRQDVVRSARKGLIGMVMEVGGDPESDSSDSDDDDSGDSLSNGQVRVIWADHTETKDNADDIVVVDRAFVHGDVVADVSDPTGQAGIVVDVDIRVDLLSADGEMIKDISSRDLQRIRDFTLGDYVLNGFWLGRVDEVLDNVTVMFDDGSVCKVIRADPMRLSPVSTSLLEDAHFPYYPGQRVKASSSSVFKNSRWISGSWKASRVEGTVVKVQAASIFVYWIASASTGDVSNSLGIPSEEQDPKNLKLLSCLAYENWQLGDWCLLSSSKPHPPLRVSEVSPGSEHGISFKSSDSQINGIDESVSNHVEDMDNESCNEGSAVNSHDSGITSTNIHNLMNPKESVCDVRDEGDWCSTNSNKLESDDDDLRSHLDLQETAARPEGGGKLPCDQPSNDCIGLNETQKLPENPIPDNVSSEFGSCCSSVSVIKEHAQESRVSHRKKLRKIAVKRERKTKRKDEAFERALLIASTVTKASVIWQNGVRQSGIHSRDLIPIDDTGDGEFYPEHYVVEKPSNEDEDISAVKRVGVVKSVDAKERTACVRWSRPVSRPEDPREFDAEELVSVYELDQHPDYDYCYGDTVIRLSPASGVDTSMGCNSDEQLRQSEMEQSFNNMGAIDEPMQQQSEQVHEHENLSHLGDLSWVGTITGLKDGDIEVTWADGMVSTVGPQAVFIVGRDEDDDSSQDNEDDAGDNISWETVDPDDMDTLENIDEENKDDGLQCDIVQDAAEEKATASAGEDEQGQNGGLSIPLAAIGFVTTFASGLLFGGRKVTDPSETNNTSLDGSAQFEADTSENSIVEFSTDDKPRFEQNDSGLRTLLAEDFGSFKHFDSATSTEDHYFFNENAQSSNDRKWIKKVQQEWAILEKNLPETIYVRVYEDRMDLLRAVIVGAYGTPYQDGLFFFDFYLPPEYPQIPPLAYYHSGGLLVNPNLYENGKVCLSLLNTWTGKGNEVWDPSSSSILQVLVSLQGLVLNAKPYFNEAGYDRQVGTTEGEKNSLLYNENSFLLSCKSMLYILRRPPKNFEELVKQHYQKRGPYILKACDAYLKGALVGSLTKDATVGENTADHESSAGLKLMLAKIVPKLLTALKEVGAECHQFEHFAS